MPTVRQAILNEMRDAVGIRVEQSPDPDDSLSSSEDGEPGHEQQVLLPKADDNPKTKCTTTTTSLSKKFEGLDVHTLEKKKEDDVNMDST